MSHLRLVHSAPRRVTDMRVEALLRGIVLAAMVGGTLLSLWAGIAFVFSLAVGA